MFKDDMFGEKVPEIESDTKVIVVADYFVEEIQGGAELTTEALIKSSPVKTQKIKANRISLKLLEDGQDCFWIFGNYASLDVQLIPTIVTNLNYSIIEYDYKFCKYRSIEKHKATSSDCNCHNEMQGKMISAFMYGAKSLWYMSESQKRKYEKRFPFLDTENANVLSSTFSDEAFAALKTLRGKYTNKKNDKWLVLGSNSWIKGTQNAIDWCNTYNKDFEIINNLSYDQCLLKLAESKGLVFLPLGSDTCPRIVIEAKLLGCDLEINDNVEHKNEEWFDTSDLLMIESYLYAARDLFWNGILNSMSWCPTISGYTTTLNCIKNKYPWKVSIQSMLNFCDEVVVVDGGSSDKTYNELVEWSKYEEKLKVFQVKRDWNHTRFAIFDGAQKAQARNRCTMDFCWQMDADEVVHEDDYTKIKNLIKKFPGQVDLVSLPVIEFWGSNKKIRLDVTPWKWRLSRNLPNITHGIPKELRRTDDRENLYAHLGTDGCDYIDYKTYDRIPHASFYTEDIESARSAAISGNTDALEQYNTWFERVIETLPSVYHYSWFDIPRKIRTYRDYWSKHWQSLYNIEQEDIPENNMFFDKAWSSVTESDIKKMGKKLSKDTGGWIFHSRIDFSKVTPSLTSKRSEPKIVLESREIKKSNK